jgi:GT2 family glycosyltransferase
VIYLSVIIPTYNRGAALGQCLEALAAACDEHTAGHLEVIVVDDGSTDGSRQRVESRATDYPVPLHYLWQENQGPAAARNLGVRHAHGDVTWFIGDDVFVQPETVRVHLDIHSQAAAGHPIGVLGPVTWHPSLTVTPFMRWWERYRFKYPPEYLDPVPFWYFYTCNVSVGRDLFLECGGFDEEFPYAAYEDTELAYRLYHRGMRIVYAPEALAYHHHPTDLASASRQIEALGGSYDTFVRKTGDRGLPIVWLIAARLPLMMPFMMRPIQRMAERLQWHISFGPIYTLVLVYHFLVGRGLRPPLSF